MAAKAAPAQSWQRNGMTKLGPSDLRRFRPGRDLQGDVSHRPNITHINDSAPADSPLARERLFAYLDDRVTGTRSSVPPQPRPSGIRGDLVGADDDQWRDQPD